MAGYIPESTNFSSINTFKQSIHTGTLGTYEVCFILHVYTSFYSYGSYAVNILPSVTLRVTAVINVLQYHVLLHTPRVLTVCNYALVVLSLRENK